MRYALVGDSQGQGVFGPLASYLQAAGHVVVLSRAVPGKAPAWWAADTSLPGQLAGARPDVVVYLVAGNNTDLDPSSYARSAATLVGHARNAGARTVYWLSPALAVREPYASYHNRTASLEPSILASLGARWLDMRPLTTTGHRDDGVHFTSSAYQAWAARLAPMLTASSPLAVLGAGAGTAWWWALPVAGVALFALVALRRRRGAVEYEEG